ncbi:hypothetical protein KAK07_23450 [Ideonella sp. 4Y16]|uniref:Uncharacterized protein n=1 Tax=Ideonella aquatica TaxID=2824119 RepID=A0A941BKG1_9BURK|nr:MULTISPECIES: hypothetical protein [Ideonella]MBQ0946315.1 hypothetical protein [Ideonella alba]MBQ0960477.1 hypothetical protein [Ideonella aquatica]
MATLDHLSFEQACAKASARARRSGQERYVVHEGDGTYAVACEDDLDTWWLGATVLAAFDADGCRLD